MHYVTISNTHQHLPTEAALARGEIPMDVEDATSVEEEEEEHRMSCAWSHNANCPSFAESFDWTPENKENEQEEQQESEQEQEGKFETSSCRILLTYLLEEQSNVSPFVPDIERTRPEEEQGKCTLEYNTIRNAHILFLDEQSDAAPSVPHVERTQPEEEQGK